MSSLRAPWQNGPYKIKHTEQHNKTDIQNKLVFVFYHVSIIINDFWNGQAYGENRN